MTIEDEVAKLIIEFVRQHKNVKGAVVGKRINEVYPGLHLRASYGGLKHFINRYCSKYVRIAGKYGPDDVYNYFDEFEQDAPAPSQSTPLNSPLPVVAIEETGWKAFSSPSSQAFLWANISVGEMRVAFTEEGLDTNQWKQVPKTTTEDHRLIARNFLLQIEETDRPQFQQILLTQEFWDAWFHGMQSFSHGKYLRHWLSFRFTQICELFLDRLKALNVPEELRLSMLQSLKGSKTKHNVSSVVSASNVLQPMTKTSELPAANFSPVSLREAIIKVIHSLSEEELRRVWLPIGAFADAVRGQPSQ